MSRIALIHAVAVAMPPVTEAFRQLWPEAQCMNILEDALSPDRERDGELTEAMSRRIAALAHYALDAEADAILYTCSAFGEAIEAVAAKAPVPVLKPNEAMFDAALSRGRRIGMLATFNPSVASMEQEFRDAAAQRKSDAQIETICVAGAMAALKSGDGATHDRLLAEAAPQLKHCDAVMLAHFSTSRAEKAVSAVLNVPVLTSPGSAVRKLRAIMKL
jgi:maleate cis-trans isomerase